MTNGSKTSARLCVMILALVFVWLSPKLGAHDKYMAKAKQIFEQYIALEKAFSPNLADLYAGNALIQNTRRYPNGTTRTLRIPAVQYKTMIKTMLPAAKLLGDTNRYYDVKYKPDQRGTRIECMRYSDRKQYASPMQLLVGPNGPGQWTILEEISESQP